MEKEVDGIYFYVHINGVSFDSEDEIYVKVTARNVSGQDIEYYSGSSSCPRSPIGIWIIDENNNEPFVAKQKDDDEGRACTEDVATSILKNGDSVENQLTLYPKVRLSSDEVPVTTGAYPLEISFSRVGDKEFHKPYITQYITVMSPAQPIIARNEIEQYALKHPEVKKWIDDHTGDAIAKIEDGEHYILWYDGWQKTSKEHYDELKNGIYQQERGLHYDNGFWVIQYLSKIGSAPHRIEIKLDAVTGDVVEVQTFER